MRTLRWSLLRVLSELKIPSRIHFEGSNHSFPFGLLFRFMDIYVYLQNISWTFFFFFSKEATRSTDKQVSRNNFKFLLTSLVIAFPRDQWSNQTVWPIPSQSFSQNFDLVQPRRCLLVLMPTKILLPSIYFK